jgi:hypothetical protein
MRINRFARVTTGFVAPLALVGTLSACSGVGGYGGSAPQEPTCTLAEAALTQKKNQITVLENNKAINTQYRVPWITLRDHLQSKLSSLEGGNSNGGLLGMFNQRQESDETPKTLTYAELTQGLHPNYVASLNKVLDDPRPMAINPVDYSSATQFDANDISILFSRAEWQANFYQNAIDRDNEAIVAAQELINACQTPPTQLVPPAPTGQNNIRHTNGRRHLARNNVSQPQTVFSTASNGIAAYNPKRVII